MVTIKRRFSTAMTLADFSSLGLILPALSCDGAASAIKELSRVLQAENCVPDLLPFYQAALNREFMVSTDMEAGMAFPHARVPGLKQVVFALGRSPQPLPWGPSAERSVRLVFLIAVPATDATQYLLLISGLARLSKDGALVARLQSAPEPLQMFEVLREVALRTHSALDPQKKAAT